MRCSTQTRGNVLNPWRCVAARRKCERARWSDTHGRGGCAASQADHCRETDFGPAAVVCPRYKAVGAYMRIYMPLCTTSSPSLCYLRVIHLPLPLPPTRSPTFAAPASSQSQSNRMKGRTRHSPAQFFTPTVYRVGSSPTGQRPLRNSCLAWSCFARDEKSSLARIAQY